MKLRSFTIAEILRQKQRPFSLSLPVQFSNNIALCFLTLALVTCFNSSSYSQSLAILAPEKTEQSDSVIERFESELSARFRILDSSMSKSIFSASGFERPYNLTAKNSRDFGNIIGANYFLLIKTDTLRRTAFKRDEYYESYIAVYLVSSRTGNLVLWRLSKFEESSEMVSRKKLFDSVSDLAGLISAKIAVTEKTETSVTLSNAEKLIEAGSEPTNGLRPPMPYRRIKPQYTDIASIYDILATVDVAVDVDADGEVLKTEVVRWAGFGLDRSVVETVRKMQWRPADLNGKPLPMRVLLRYNFKNIKSEE